MSLPHNHDERMQRARLSLDGLSLGDSFGQRFFYAPSVESLIEERALPAPPWAFTDDTVMALAIVSVLGTHGTIDRDALAGEFGSRYTDDPNRGYGPTAHGILESIAAGEDWRRVASSVFGGTGSMGNGGAMRVGPLGAYFAEDEHKLTDEARNSAEVTHAHPEGQAGAVAIAAAAAWAWNHRGCSPDDGSALIDYVLDVTPVGETRAGIERARTLPLDMSVQAAVGWLGNGIKVISPDTVPFSLWCAARHLDDFEEAMWATVSGLGDRDTTCAIVGGIVSLAVGREAIPEEWLECREGMPVRG